MKLLLHTCCAPCSVYCIKKLRSEGIEPTLYWYNPNIHPFTEYVARRDCLVQYANTIGVELLIHDVYGLDEFCCNVYNNLSQRCEQYCYPKRLRALFEYAAKNGYDTVSTTLLYSIYQKHDEIVKLMYSLSKEFGIDFLYRDFREGWREGQDEARAIGLYMQKYCGCVFSEEESMIGRKLAKDFKRVGLPPTNSNVRKVLEKQKLSGELRLDELKGQVEV